MNPPASGAALPYAEAAARIAETIAREDTSQIHPLSHTKFWTHNERTDRAVLLLHGYTDSTQQFAPLGDLLAARGYNVLAPRLPHHGYRDRMTEDHAQLTAPELIEWVSAAVDAARGLGDKLTVAGLSLGGVMATWVAENCAGVDAVVIVAPAYGTHFLPVRLTPFASRILNRLPNLFLWWDPRVRENTGNEYTYPRFGTRTIAQLFMLGDELLRVARDHPPAARVVWMVTNGNDFAVNNRLCDAFVAAWRKHPMAIIHAYRFPRRLGIPHDLVDPNERGARPDVVLPQLVEIVEQA